MHVYPLLLLLTAPAHISVCAGVDEQQEPCGDGEGGGDHPLLLFLAAPAHHPLKADLLQS